MRSGSECHLDATSDLSRYEALLQLTDLLVRHQNVPELLRAVALRLHEVAVFEFANISLYDAQRKVMRLNVWEGTASPVPIEFDVLESPSGWVWEHQQALAIPDLVAEKRFPQVLGTFRQRGLRSYCMLPLSTGEHRLGALGLGTARVGAYTDKDLQFLQRVAELVALAIENAATREALNEEKDHLKTLVEITQMLSNIDLAEKFPAIAESLRRVVPLDFASLTLADPESFSMQVFAHNIPIPGINVGAELTTQNSVAARALKDREIKFFKRSDPDVEDLPALQSLFDKGVETGCCIPLLTAKGAVGTLNIATTRKTDFGVRDVNLLQEVANQIAIALDNARAYREIADLRDKLREEKLYLEDEIRTELNFEEIVGESTALKHVLAQAKTVAGSEATVLILGETGTGKELIARAIHRMSARKDHNFIKVNCAAIPTGLLESELFGHERGAFTGAITQKIGRLELAHNGTFFLDEVGDISLELQPKLLRVLQDQEFERLGSTKTMRVDVRLIAATNQDLAKSVAERTFRSDLFYRLHVFPIRMPPLRERREDIPLLVRYFVQKFACRMAKNIQNIPGDAMNALMKWDWPGNVRELENFMERSVILSEGAALRVPLAELRIDAANGATASDTLQQAEREHIIRVLRETQGVISGPRGAAARLGLKRTTLQSKMQRLGVSREECGRSPRSDS
jgi:formate hydrogenlyase transcriptional activator